LNGWSLTNALARNPIRGALCERLGEQPIKFVFLVTEHPGIPDIEILDKLLDVRSALLTQDRVLHNLALGRGFYSPKSGLTDRRHVHVSASDKHLPVASGGLRDSYWQQSNPETQAIIECLCGFLSAHQLKQFRTKRRRIRAHFGSPDNIVAAAPTISQRHTVRGTVGGYVLKVDARHGIERLFPPSVPNIGKRVGPSPAMRRLLLGWQATCPLILIVTTHQEALDVDIEHPVVAPAALASCAHCLGRRFAGSVIIGVGLPRRLPVAAVNSRWR
jgi:hypothetical protein